LGFSTSNGSSILAANLTLFQLTLAVATEIEIRTKQAASFATVEMGLEYSEKTRNLNKFQSDGMP